MEELRAACRVIEKQHSDTGRALRCPLCTVQVVGARRLHNHIDGEHRISLVDVDEVVNLDGLLAFLQASTAARRCPVCQTTVSTTEGLAAHCESEGHAEWAPATIPALQQFCIQCHDTEGEGADADDEWADDCEDEDGDDESMMPCVCLYCSFHGKNVFSHMQLVHGVDVAAGLRLLGGGNGGDYARMAVVNFVRDAVGSERCPTCAGAHATPAALLEHMQSLKHWLPASAPEGDSWLVPRLNNDGLIQLALSLDDGTGEGEEDYPMVPTVQEIVERQQQQLQTGDVVAEASGDTE